MKRTERDLQIAFSKLLNRVRASNSWSAQSFEKCSQSVTNVSKSEAHRFQKAMLEFGYLKKSNDHRKFNPDFDIRVWKNEDLLFDMIKNILECSDIIQSRGRKTGISPYKKSEPKEESTVEVAKEPIQEQPLTLSEAIKLVKEIALKEGLSVTITLQ